MLNDDTVDKEGKLPVLCHFSVCLGGEHVSSDEELNPRWRSEEVHEVLEERQSINK